MFTIAIIIPECPCRLYAGQPSGDERLGTVVGPPRRLPEYLPSDAGVAIRSMEGRKSANGSGSVNGEPHGTSRRDRSHELNGGKDIRTTLSVAATISTEARRRVRRDSRVSGTLEVFAQPTASCSHSIATFTMPQASYFPKAFCRLSVSMAHRPEQGGQETPASFIPSSQSRQHQHQWRSCRCGRPLGSPCASCSPNHACRCGITRP